MTSLQKQKKEKRTGKRPKNSTDGNSKPSLHTLLLRTFRVHLIPRRPNNILRAQPSVFQFHSSWTISSDFGLHCVSTPGQVYTNCALLGRSPASSGNFLPTFRDNLPGPILRDQGSFGQFWIPEPWWWYPIGLPATSVRNYHYSLCNDPEERSSQLLRGGSLTSRIDIWYVAKS
jgi:hypothetical protein